MFDVVHDLKQKDLEEHKRKIEKNKLEERIIEPEPEKDKKKEDAVYNFKHLSGVRDVKVLNLGKKEDLAKILVPTKSMKIEPRETAPILTSDIQSLVVKTTPCRFYAFDDQSSPQAHQPSSIELHIKEDEDLTTKEQESTDGIQSNQELPVTKSDKSSQAMLVQPLTLSSINSNLKVKSESQGLNVPKLNFDKEEKISKSSSPLSNETGTKTTPSFSLKQSASSPGFSNFAREVAVTENSKVIAYIQGVPEKCSSSLQ